MADNLNIIGISGLSRSGKDTLANILINDGYFGVSFGDIIRDLTAERHFDDEFPIARVNMTETSNWMRETHGPDVLMKICLERYNQAIKEKSYKGLICWSIRAPVEVDFIINHGGKLIWIDVSDEVRYKRAMDDLREGEPHLSFEDYLAQENTQYEPLPGIAKSIQMDLPYVQKHATNTITNNDDDLEEFISSAKAVIEQI
jgi:dephospho-CoA kinase